MSKQTKGKQNSTDRETRHEICIDKLKPAVYIAEKYELAPTTIYSILKRLQEMDTTECKPRARTSIQNFVDNEDEESAFILE